MTTISNKQLSLAANTIRGLAMDGVQKANSGHPGLPMGMADVAAVLFLKHLKHCPSEPTWLDRDRFVLSAGHGSMLIYSLLHLSGYGLPLDELKAFRQWESLTPGHPERGHTKGVETTTGPLGQGCGNGVGMALAERMMASRYNTDKSPIFGHFTYVLASDGDLMEGISHEAFSLAGHLGLNRLIVLYDSNRISIEGSTDLAYTEDPRARFEAYKWNVLEVDGHNHEEIDKAISAAKSEQNKPTIIICNTQIGWGSPNKAGTAQSHGEPLGADEIIASKKQLGLPEDKEFHVEQEVSALFSARAEEMEKEMASWSAVFNEFKNANPEQAALLDKALSGELPEDLSGLMPEFDPKTPIATRAASGKILQKLAQAMPSLVGGSADLAPSNKTMLNDADSVGTGSFGGRNLHFGVREHAMCAMLNGMALHGGLRVYGATFFVFADYCRPSIRLAALMKLPIIYVFTHDSFYVGEDGPTHQPVEQLASLRAMPNVTVLRPADATETAAAWIAALKNQDGPSLLLLTRQGLPILDRTQHPPAALVEKGAYVVWESEEKDPDLIIMASGSEVSLALEAGQKLANNRAVRVVSMPSWELFEKQDNGYKQAVLPPHCTLRLAVEAGISMGWDKYIGPEGGLVCIDHYGASAPYKVLAEKFGFTVDNVIAAAEKL